MSLRDQLLKAGLASKKQAQQAESQKRKQEHDAKKNKELEQKLKQEQETTLKEIELNAQERRELDWQLNKNRDQLLAQRESLFRAKQLLRSQAVNQRQAQECYFFAEGNSVRRVMVTPWQREMLARGKLGIGKLEEDIDEFLIVPLECAKLVLEICPAKILSLHSEVDEETISSTYF